MSIKLATVIFTIGFFAGISLILLINASNKQDAKDKAYCLNKGQDIFKRDGYNYCKNKDGTISVIER